MKRVEKFAAIILSAAIGSIAVFSGTTCAKVVKLSMWTPFGDGAYYNRLLHGIKVYQKENPNINIELKVNPDMNTKLKVATAGGLGPDLVVTNGGVVETWNLPYMLKPLNALMKQAKANNKYLSRSVEMMSKAGVPYALPWTVDANFPVFYSRDAFSEVGLPDHAPRTPDETIEFNVKLMKKDASTQKLLRTGFVPWDWFSSTLDNWAWAFGDDNLGDGIHRKWTAPNATKAVEFYLKAGNAMGGARAVESFVAPMRSSAYNINKWTIRAMVIPMVEALFKTNKKLNVGVGYFPVTTQGVSAAWLGGQWLAIGSRCKHPKEAFDFIHWFTADLEMQKGARSFWYSGAKAAYDMNIYAAGPISDKYEKIIEFGATLIPRGKVAIGGILDGGPIIEKAIRNAVIDQSVTVSQALTEANRQINQLIDDKIKRTAGRVTK